MTHTISQLADAAGAGGAGGAGGVHGRGVRWGSDGADALLPHGFTVDRLNRTAGVSARGSMWGYPPYLEKVDLARFAILEHLYTCAEHVDTRENGHPCNLLRVGQRAITRHIKQDGAFRGVAVGRDGYTTGDQLIKYQVFWTSTATPTRSPEDPVVNAVALRQIWPLLEPKYQRALLALAEHEDYDAAAQALGLAYHSVIQYVHEGRKVFLWYWHQHEKPSRVWGVDRRRRKYPLGQAPHRSSIMGRTFAARKRYHKRKRQTAGGGLTPTAQMRAWAIANGWTVNAHGRLRSAVIEAYTKATNERPPNPEPTPE